MKKLLILVAVMGLGALYGTNYYVDSQNGNDTGNNGTSTGSPFKTIQKAADTVQPGDSVFVRGGFYREAVVFNTSGTANGQIVFTAYPGETPILDGSEPLTGWARCASAADCGGNPHYADIWYAVLPAGVDPGGMALYEQGEALGLAQFPNQPDPFYNDQVEYYKITPTAGYTTTTLVDPEVFTQSDPAYWVGTRIWLWGGNNNISEEVITQYVPAEHKVVFTEMNFAVNIQTDRYSLLNHISILDTAGEYVVDTMAQRVYVWTRSGADPNRLEMSRGALKNGFRINGKNHITIQGFTIRNYSEYSLTYSRDGNGIINYSTMFSRGLIVRDNRITTIKGDGITLGGCSNCIIERNYLGSIHGAGIYHNQAESTVVRDNEVYQTSSTAIRFYRSRQCQALFNYVHECNGHHGNGLTFYLGCHNILVFGNRVIRGNIACTIQQSEGIYIINNILFNPDNHRQGIAVWGAGNDPQYPSDPAIDSLVFLNNLVYGSIGAGGNIKHTVNRNNIVGGYCLNDAKTWDHGYNLVFEGAWCQPSGGEGVITEKDVDKIFTDYNGDDFTLLPTSPAVDAATDVSAFWPLGVFPDFNYSQDIRGVARPVGSAWDIGPYEYTTNAIADFRLPIFEGPALPNPIKKANIEYRLKNEDFRIMDLSGKEVFSGRDLKYGIYLARTGDGRRLVKTVIVE